MTGRTAAAGGWLLLPGMMLAALVGVASGVAPVLALGGAAALVVLGLVLADATALLVVLVAAFPWDDALPYPSETVSLIKILGALLFVGYVLRALARSESVLVPPTLMPLVIFTIMMLLSLVVSEDIAEGITKALRYLLFATFFFVFVQLVRTRVGLLMGDPGPDVVCERRGSGRPGRLPGRISQPVLRARSARRTTSRSCLRP